MQGLLDLYESNQQIEWLQLASQLTETQIKLFWDTDNGGFFETNGRDASLLWRMKENSDGAEPAGNSVAAMNLLRLGQMLDHKDWREKARQTIAAFSNHLQQAPSSMPQMLLALEYAQAKARQIIIAGPPSRADTQAMFQHIHQRFLPHKILLSADGASGQNWLGKQLEIIESMRPMQGQATAYVCYNYACKRPTNDLAVLDKQLSESNNNLP